MVCYNGKWYEVGWVYVKMWEEELSGNARLGWPISNNWDLRQRRKSKFHLT